MSAGRERVLVLGATGMLGHAAVEVFAERFEVHGTARDLGRASRFGLPAELHELEATRPEGLAALLDSLRPAAVLNCVGLVKQLEEASRPAAAIALNALFPHQVAAACEAAGARLIHISTDCVFAGERDAGSAYTESDRPDARDLYGLTKLMGEVTGAGALTIRTSMIGWELERAAGLLGWLVSQPGPAVDGYTGAFFSGLSTRALAEVLATVIAEHPGLTGLHHVSAEPIAKHDLLVALRDALGLELEIRPVPEPRVNRVLDSSRFLAATGISVPSWAAMIGELAKGRRGAPA